MTAIRRVEAFVKHEAEWGHAKDQIMGSFSSCCGTVRLTMPDLMELLAIAKQTAELKQRMRRARHFVARPYDWSNGGPYRKAGPDWLSDLLAMLDLRQPLPKRGRR